ncbi:MAG: hypothetical protein ACK44N_01835, partial [Bacteroidota bacterium]
ILVIVALFASNLIFAQNKKEQIEILNARVDSLSIELRILNAKHIDAVNALNNKDVRIDELTKENLSLKKYLVDSISSLSKKVANLKLINDSLSHSLAYISDMYSHVFNSDKENENNAEKFVGVYKNGLKDGHWIYYLCGYEEISAKKTLEGDYINGKKNGKWTNYDYCNNAFNFSNLKDVYSYFYCLFTLADYYRFEDENSWNISKEVVYFDKGIPRDTLYYYDDNDQLIIKVAWKNGNIYFNNNQPFSNQKCRFEYPFLVGLGNSDLEIFYREGQVRYRITKNGENIKEEYFAVDGYVLVEGEYFKGNGTITTYNMNGQVVDKFDAPFGSGKFGPECHCQ